MSEMQTARRFGEPQVVQFSVFLDNRVGRLGSLLKLFHGTHVRVAALSVVHSVDCAIVRCVLAPSDDARPMLQQAGLAISETELVVAELPKTDDLVDMCYCLLKAEVNIHYVYPLLVKPHGNTAIALHVDEPATAASMLRKSGFTMLGENDL